jgi:DNA-directed RNA polymerase specialized sigma24 family protein
VAVSGKEAGRGLTPAEFDALLAMLHRDREVAGQIYEGIRNRLIRMFEWRRCAHPEDLADETFNRVARKSAEGLALQRSDPYAYFCGVAHHVFQESARREQRENRFRESGDWPPSAPPEDEPDLRLEHLRQCLETLAADQKRLLLRYHEDQQRIRSRKILCDELGIPMNALRIRVHRLRKKVEACVEEKLRNELMKRFPASGHIKSEARQGDDLSRTRDYERP